MIPMAVDVLFIHPGNHSKSYQALAAEFTAIAPPAWALLLAGALRNRGIGTAIHDVNVEGWDDDILRSLLARHAPRMVAIIVQGHNPSASTQTMPAARRIALDLKRIEPDLPLAFGGTHPSALPSRTLDEEPVDYVLQGEGLYTLEGLVGHVKGTLDIESVRGLWYRKDGAATPTAPAPVIADLDAEMPRYEWDLLPPLAAYRAHNMHCFDEFRLSERADFSDVRSPYAVLHTSLGCPYACHYCCVHAL
ncbi:MAG TPA: cobalamin-dependent protein, partial [Candidatus Deferrimicrobiaceae bacterium]